MVLPALLNGGFSLLPWSASPPLTSFPPVSLGRGLSCASVTFPWLLPTAWGDRCVVDGILIEAGATEDVEERLAGVVDCARWVTDPVEGCGREAVDGMAMIGFVCNGVTVVITGGNGSLRSEEDGRPWVRFAVC